MADGVRVGDVEGGRVGDVEGTRVSDGGGGMQLGTQLHDDRVLLEIVQEVATTRNN